MITEEFPKLSPQIKALGDRDWCQLPCAVLAQALLRLFYFIPRALACQLLLKLSFVSIFQGIIMIAPPWMGTLLERGMARAVSGKSHQVTPFQALQTPCTICPCQLLLLLLLLVAGCPDGPDGPEALRQEGRDKGNVGAHLLPTLHSEVLVMPGWSPGVLSSSVCSSMPHPQPHPNFVSTEELEGCEKQCGSTGPPRQEFPEQKEHQSPVSYKLPQFDTPVATHTLCPHLSQAKPPPEHLESPPWYMPRKPSTFTIFIRQSIREAKAGKGN